MDEYITWEVYTNLLKMLEYRGIKRAEEPMTADAFAQNLNHYNYVMITGTRPVSDPREHSIIIVEIAPGSSYATKSADFKRLLQKIPVAKAVESKQYTTNIVFISEHNLTTHINKQLNSYSRENPNVYLESYDPTYFKIESPKHSLVPPHSIPTEEEVMQFCDKWRISPWDLPKISRYDTMAVWLGLRYGMVVKIMRISETAGQAIAYKICVNE